MNGFRIWLPVAVLSLGAMMAMARPQDSAAAKPAGAALSIGYVDVDEVAEKSAVGQEAQKKAKEERDRLQGELRAAEEAAFLSSEEQAELKRLQGKPDRQRSDADKARIAELKGASERLLNELQTLQQKSSPTDADRARIGDLTRRFQTAREQLENEKATAEAKLREIMGKIMTDLEERIMKAVDEEARARGVAMVVRKEMRLYGGEDMTGGVINRLKK